MAFEADQPPGPVGPPPSREAQSGDGTDPHERDMIAFAKVWAPYGGGSQADIFIRFGLIAKQYFTRLTTLLGSSSAAELTAAQRRTVFEVCVRRLAQTQYPPAVADRRRPPASSVEP
jgi:hypothetical protein